MSREKPILFNADDIRATLDGRKSVKRIVIKPQPTYSEKDGFSWKRAAYGTDLPPTVKGAAHNFICACPYQPGDILYVRETWRKSPFTKHYIFKADGEEELFKQSYDSEIMDDTVFKWKPSIHMPKEAARIWLKVTDVRVEQLQDIKEEQAKAEGTNWKNGKNVGWEEKMKRTAIDRFADIWNSTIKKKDLPIYGWNANPWVWVIEFERCEKPEE